MSQEYDYAMTALVEAPMVLRKHRQGWTKLCDLIQCASPIMTAKEVNYWATTLETMSNVMADTAELIRKREAE